MNATLRTIFYLFLILIITDCNRSNNLKTTVKFQPNDPFKATMTPSQEFNIDGKKDNVIEGENGTMAVFPKGCFLNSNGEVVEANVKIELSEALYPGEMLLSNLTATSDGKPLETDGMIYFNATSNGEQLMVNKEIPVHFEILTNEKKPGMMAYKGVRDEKGNMNWIEPKPLDNFLVTVDINSLDFLPEGFKTAVDNEMISKNKKAATQQYTDSLYYSFSVSNENELLNGMVNTNLNEAYYDKNKKIVNKKYTSESYSVTRPVDSINKDTAKRSNCGIDPAIIKVIKSEKYQKTLIATREFETRLRTIFQTCRNDLLDIYIKNLDKNLYEIDSMAAAATNNVDNLNYHAFYSFYQQKLTKVKNADKYAALIKGYYEKRLSEIKAGLEKTKEKLIKSLQEKNEGAQKITDDYKKLLWKREKYRMETYGFNWTETGWINIDNGTIPKSWDSEPLEVIVDNGKQYDRVYTYINYDQMKSLYRLSTTDNENFYVGNDEKKQMLMPKNSTASVIVIAYKGDNVAKGVIGIVTVRDKKINILLHPTTIDSLKQSIALNEEYRKENQISSDLEFMEKLFKEEQRQKNIKAENEYLERLRAIVYHCCYNDFDIGPWSRLEDAVGLLAPPVSNH